jgi:hypothetical protein
MDEITIKMLRLAAQGFRCSQIIIILGLEIKGESNPSLVKAMAGLAGGCGSGKGSCGALTGGSCLLALFLGKGTAAEEASDLLLPMLEELVEWFESEVGEKCGGLDCNSIRHTQANGADCPGCSAITRAVYDKCLALLTRTDIDLRGPNQ